MNVFTSTFGYSFDQLVVVRVSGSNSIGFGPTSLPNTAGAKIRTAPLAMNPPSRGSLSTDNSIQVVWSDPGSPITGNSPILSYNLYWDNGTGITSISLVDSNVLSFIIGGVTPGKTYMFKIRARNIYGLGAFSNDFSLIASDIPD